MYCEKLIQLFQFNQYKKIIFVCSNKIVLKWYEYFLLGYSYVRTNNPKKAVDFLLEGLEKTKDSFQKCLLILVLMEAVPMGYEKYFEELEQMRDNIGTSSKRDFVLGYSAVIEARATNRNAKSKIATIQYSLVLLSRAFDTEDKLVLCIASNLLISAMEGLIEYYNDMVNPFIQWPIRQCIEYYKKNVEELSQKKKFRLLSNFQREYGRYAIRQDYNAAMIKCESLLGHKVYEG